MHDQSLSALPLVGVDTGGTFTDFFWPREDGVRTLKVLSTPDDPSRAIIQGLRQLGLDGQHCLIIHGTTVATNAVLEGKASPVIYITNEGFADVLSIGRQQRRQIYALQPEPHPAPVAANDCIEVDCRLGVNGEWLKPLSDEALTALAQQLRELNPVAVAINLIHGWRRPEVEQRIASACPESAFVSRGSEVLPAAGEYERGIAAWLNAGVGPVLQRYLRRLAESLPKARISVMQSDGMTIAADQAAAKAIHLLLSGPAGGVAAAAYLASMTGRKELLTFDMGGTSSDVSLVRERPLLTHEGLIGHWPVAVPMADIHTIGAGGGSLAHIDQGGLLRVGPQSAGAYPGPACYGRGGGQATVTDAHVVLGRIPANQALAGHLSLDAVAARTAVGKIAETLSLSLAQAANGIIRLANEHMARALRVVSADRGEDPQRATLVSFGGAGGLHACELAELLAMREVLIAPHAGVLSAMGMTVAAPGRRQIQSVLLPLEEVEATYLEQHFQRLERQARNELVAEGLSEQDIRHDRALGLRYHGQKLVIEVPWSPQQQAWLDCFLEKHQQRCGYLLDRRLEVAQITLLTRASPRQLATLADQSQRVHSESIVDVWHDQKWTACPQINRALLNNRGGLNGPAIVAEKNTTVWVPPNWRVRLDEKGLLWITRQSQSSS